MVDSRSLACIGNRDLSSTDRDERSVVYHSEPNFDSVSGMWFVTKREQLRPGMVAQGASMHPFGAVILVWAIVVVCVSLSPTTMRSRVASFLQNHHRPVMILYVGFVVSFVAFGVLRAVSHFAPFSITTPPP